MTWVLERHVFWDWFRKLSLIVATALAGFVLGPYLTTKWQDHKEALDTRSALVERISNAVGEFAGAAQAQAYANPAARPKFDASFVRWQVESEAINTQIAAYVADASAGKEWTNFAYAMTWVYYLFNRNGAVKPTFALHRVADYLHRPFNTLDGLLESPVVRSTGTVNPTYNGALLSLVLHLRLRERMIVAHILGKG